ncbi:MAG: formate--tetrahydrofolate ligase [Gemmatimonadales bacterium]|nr:MAG: formate--tetrahydrofolate ligase [Gemmatimonadales bacterium]
MLTDIQIAQAADVRPIAEIAEKLGLSHGDIHPHGHTKAKVPLEAFQGRSGSPGKLVLVTGMNPTPAGEGKSTISVGLADALTLRDRNPVVCLREPSLGPVFGMKGGAAGGGYSQVVPMDEINLHFTGDFHAISSANALLAAMLDNHLHRPNTLGIDSRRVVWKRAVDMNDRALRSIVIGLGGATQGFPREDGFNITAASEVMAILCLADGITDLERRLGNAVVAYNGDGEAIRARDLNAQGAMTLLLKDAIAPNLVQTLGGTPAFIHGGPFANIAHGCNSVLATQAGLALGDVVVTEAGFGADLGAEKFFDIKCRAAGLRPDAVVIAATVRALKMNGGRPKSELATEDLDALARGFPNLARHVENVRKFGVEPVVALNRFPQDTDAEVEAAVEACRALGVAAIPSDPYTRTGVGCLDLADAVWDMLSNGAPDFRPLYPDDMPLLDKIRTIAREIYRAEGVDVLPAARRQLEDCEALGLGEAPVCMAKTQYSFSDDATLLGAPEGFRITVREVSPSAGAGFVVVKTGSMMTMPGLPVTPGAEGMRVDEDGTITGLA